MGRWHTSSHSKQVVHFFIFKGFIFIYQIYSLIDDMLIKTIGNVVQLPQDRLTAGVEEDAYRKKVLRTFLRSASQATPA